MSLAGPSRLSAMASLIPQRTIAVLARRSSSAAQLRHFSRSSLSAKPLTPETISASYDPPLSSSIAMASSLTQQRVRQRISELDSRIDPPSHILRDRHSRQHTYLRISLTEKCNLRCLYCMPEDGVPLTPSPKLLSTSEIERLASLFVSQGVNKIRLTGGEPTVRSDLPQIVSSLAALKQHGLEQIGITTNGIALGRRKLDTLVQNGLTHLNVSLDTLDPFKFEFMTRRRGHEAVMDCIERALGLGMKSVKINVVVIKGLNDTKDVVDFVRFTKDKPITIRFIEYMPFDGNKWQVQKLVPYRDLVETIQKEFPTFERVTNRDDPNDTSKHWRVPGHQGTVGFITSMTDNFCGTCNRLRVTADGNLKVCLFGNAEVSLRDAMRTGFGPIPSLSTGSNGEPATDEQLLQLIGAAVGRKHAKHAGMRDPTELARSLNRPMITIGGPAKRSEAFVKRSISRQAFSRGSLAPRRAFHSSARRSRREEEEEDDDDNPWGDLDKAFENLQDKSLYKQVYLNHPAASTPPAPSSAPRERKDPIAEMEEAIFAQAGAAAAKGPSKSQRNVVTAPLSGVKFSDMPPRPESMSSMMGGMGGVDMAGASGARWSEYMQSEGQGMMDDDGPWSSLDAFVDNPEASAEFAVPLHMQPQHQVMGLSAQQHTPPRPYRQQLDSHTVGEAFAANDDLLQQQIQMQRHSDDPEESAFAAAGAAAVANLFKSPTSAASVSSIQEDSTTLSHINPTTGGASMVDVSPKTITSRSATAVGRIYLPTPAASLVRSTESHSGVSGKGPVLHTAQLAGIMAAKRTADLIPLCHPLPLTHVDVKLSISDGDVDEGEGGESWIQVECTAKTAGQTGVEMEALTGCTVACLTVWDMVKAVAGKTMRMGDVMVVRKSGGKSGDWERSA
ncbi:related to Molybdopterin biosynthesis CNX2 protein [Ustilago trichophora]|uniref:Related to Molybdopterin biosynthesis CNX2 protein n=1 Tax=Ustilago trichophora TaxID=86804 RepID=A0A5C3DNI8_9BASI|nr:related to Molybdopterin biosynthesis CNX2 protein [Ustilago trichophora]